MSLLSTQGGCNMHRNFVPTLSLVPFVLVKYLLWYWKIQPYQIIYNRILFTASTFLVRQRLVLSIYAQKYDLLFSNYLLLNISIEVSLQPKIIFHPTFIYDLFYKIFIDLSFSWLIFCHDLPKLFFLSEFLLLWNIFTPYSINNWSVCLESDRR